MSRAWFFFCVLCLPTTAIARPVYLRVSPPYKKSIEYKKLRKLLELEGYVVSSQPDEKQHVTTLHVQSRSRILIQKGPWERSFLLPHRLKTSTVRARAMVVYLALFADWLEQKHLPSQKTPDTPPQKPIPSVFSLPLPTKRRVSPPEKREIVRSVPPKKPRSRILKKVSKSPAKRRIARLMPPPIKPRENPPKPRRKDPKNRPPLKRSVQAGAPPNKRVQPSVRREDPDIVRVARVGAGSPGFSLEPDGVGGGEPSVGRKRRSSARREDRRVDDPTPNIRQVPPSTPKKKDAQPPKRPTERTKQPVDRRKQPLRRPAKRRKKVALLIKPPTRLGGGRSITSRRRLFHFSLGLHPEALISNFQRADFGMPVFVGAGLGDWTLYIGLRSHVHFLKIGRPIFLLRPSFLLGWSPLLPWALAGKPLRIEILAGAVMDFYVEDRGELKYNLIQGWGFALGGRLRWELATWFTLSLDVGVRYVPPFGFTGTSSSGEIPQILQMPVGVGALFTF
ncbi:MAG: hypothetical protein H6727_08915 [Myxococcales bacterium]|nr:hypothetical protein [Myxococcales bacterium]